MSDPSIVAVSERMGSPNKVRIGHLSEKLVSLQDELEHEKQVTLRHVRVCDVPA